jgi:hypothetical protein
MGSGEQECREIAYQRLFFPAERSFPWTAIETRLADFIGLLLSASDQRVQYNSHFAGVQEQRAGRAPHPRSGWRHPF